MLLVKILTKDPSLKYIRDRKTEIFDNCLAVHESRFSKSLLFCFTANIFLSGNENFIPLVSIKVPNHSPSRFGSKSPLSTFTRNPDLTIFEAALFDHKNLCHLCHRQYKQYFLSRIPAIS